MIHRVASNAGGPAPFVCVVAKTLYASRRFPNNARHLCRRSLRGPATPLSAVIRVVTSRLQSGKLGSRLEAYLENNMKRQSVAIGTLAAWSVLLGCVQLFGVGAL